MKKTKKSMTFTVGDRVTWKSQAGGHWKTKTGTVVEVVPAHRVSLATPMLVGMRDHESYIVEVAHPAKRSTSTIKSARQKKPERYRPIVSGLKLVRRAAVATAADEIAGRPDGVHKSAGAATLPDEDEKANMESAEEAGDPYLAGILNKGDESSDTASVN